VREYRGDTLALALAAVVLRGMLVGAAALYVQIRSAASSTNAVERSFEYDRYGSPQGIS
jgi:hypothetical protein